MSNEYWNPSTKGNHSAYDAAIVDRIYSEELVAGAPMRAKLLELSQYLEMVSGHSALRCP